MELFLKRLKKAFEKVFGLSVIVVFIVVIFMFSGLILLNLKKIQAFWYVYQGDKHSGKYEYQEAIENYQHALNIYPQHVKARYNLGNIYVAYEDFDSAVECYQKALSYDTNYINARISLGIILAEERLDLDGAIEEYEKAIKTRVPVINIPLIYDNAGMIKQNKSIVYYDMGLAYRDKSLLYLPDSIESVNFLRKAADCYEKSLALNSENYDAQYNLALTYHLLGLYTDALRGYCRAMLIAPLNYESYYNLAILLRQRGQYKYAADEFRRAGFLASNTYKSFFIYQILNEVSAMAIAQHGFESKKIMERLDTQLADETDSIKEEDERALTVDELEQVLIKRIKTSSVCKAYIENE